MQLSAHLFSSVQLFACAFVECVTFRSRGERNFGPKTRFQSWLTLSPDLLTVQVNSRIWAIEKERMGADSVAMEAYLSHLRLRTSPTYEHLPRPEVIAPSPAPARSLTGLVSSESSGDAPPSVTLEGAAPVGWGSRRQHAVHVHTGTVRAAGPTGDPFVTNSIDSSDDQLHQQRGFWEALLAADPIIQVRSSLLGLRTKKLYPNMIHNLVERCNGAALAS